VKRRIPDPKLHLIAGFTSALAVSLVFLPVMFSHYGIYDAVRMALDFTWAGESRLMGVMLGGGRFLYAWIAQLGFGSMETIEDLWFLRAVGILSLILCAFVVTVYACRQGWGYLAAVCVAIVAIVNPGTAVYGFWSACFPYGCAILASLLAGILWERIDWKSRVASLLLMQMSLMIYQPAALYFFLGPFLAWFGNREKPARPFVAVWCSLGIFLNLLVHVTVVRLVVGIFPELPVQSSRLIDGGLVEAVRNLLTSVLPRVFSGWGDLFPGHFALGMILIMGLGWILFFLKSRGTGDLILKVLCIIPIAFTLLPAFVSADGYAPCRLLAPAYCGAGVIALAGFARGFSGRFPLRIISITGLGLVLLIAGSYSVQFGIVKPRVLEISVIRQVLEESGPEAPKGMTIIRPKGTYPIDKHILQKAEYGAFELTYGGFSEAYLSLIAADVFDWSRDGQNPINRVLWIFCPDTVETVPPFFPILDLREHLQGLSIEPLAVSQGSPVHHPYLGDALFFPPALYLTPGLGLTRQEADRWFFMAGYGWMQWTSDPDELPLVAQDIEGELHSFETP